MMVVSERSPRVALSRATSRFSCLPMSRTAAVLLQAPHSYLLWPDPGFLRHRCQLHDSTNLAEALDCAILARVVGGQRAWAGQSTPEKRQLSPFSSASRTISRDCAGKVSRVCLSIHCYVARALMQGWRDSQRCD